MNPDTYLSSIQSLPKQQQVEHIQKDIDTIVDHYGEIWNIPPEKDLEILMLQNLKYRILNNQNTLFA